MHKYMDRRFVICSKSSQSTLLDQYNPSDYPLGNTVIIAGLHRAGPVGEAGREWEGVVPARRAERG